MKNITVSNNFLSRWKSVSLGCIECDVIVTAKNKYLWDNIISVSDILRQKIEIEKVSLLPAINSSRKAYRAFGKDPARYRLSAEALIRRILKGNDLYQVNNVVDIVNLISLETGFSIGGYDSNKIKGNIVLDIGNENDIYEGIGRGILNIDSLPVLRDEEGAFGSPTSDSERTNVNLETKRFLMVIFGFGEFNKANSAIDMAIDLLSEYSEAENITTKIISHE